MRWRFVLITAGKITGFVLAGFFFLGFLIIFFYEKEIKQVVIDEVNKNLQTKIQVEEFEFSVFRHFPLASIDLKKVMVEEATHAKEKDTLLYANRLSLLFKINDVFNRDVTIRKVLIYDGMLNIVVDDKGHGNYHFLKKSDTPTQGDVGIEKIGLSNVYLKYTDRNSKQDYAMMAKSAEVSGVFGSEKFSFSTKADLFIDRLFIHGENYADRKSVTLHSGLTADLKKGTYEISDSKIKINGLGFGVVGNIAEMNSRWSLNLMVHSADARINEIRKVLPTSLAVIPENFKYDGVIAMDAKINGPVGQRNIPDVSMTFRVKDGVLTSGDASFKKINFSAGYEYSTKLGKNTLVIPSLNASLAGHLVEASMQLDGLPDAYLTVKAKTRINLKDLMPFLQLDTLESLSGDLAINLSYQGKVHEINKVRKGQWNEVNASGNVDVNNLCFKLKKNPLAFKDLSGNFTLQDNDVLVNNFRGNVSSSDFCFNGVFRNFISFLLIDGQPGDFQAKVTSTRVDLDELLVNKSSVNTGDTSYIMKFNPRLICRLDVNIGKLSFRRFNAVDIRGHIDLDKQVISGRDLQLSAMGGNVVLDATINASRRDSINMLYDASFSNVDVTRLFYEMENFDQSTLTDKNVKGKVSAEVQFISSWKNDLTLNSSSVRSTAAITIENGELLNFLPIQRLSGFMHIPDLNHIRFSSLKNNISIANRKISIPRMDIQSSAINISGNGIHDFDNNIDYHLVILLSDVLGRKVRSNTSEFGEIADDGLGKTKLFLSMKGTVDSPKFSYDRKAAGEKIRQDVAYEKQHLKSILKKEFGMFKSDPSVQAPKQKKKQEMQIDWSEQ